MPQSLLIWSHCFGACESIQQRLLLTTQQPGSTRSTGHLPQGHTPEASRVYLVKLPPPTVPAWILSVESVIETERSNIYSHQHVQPIAIVVFAQMGHGQCL